MPEWFGCTADSESRVSEASAHKLRPSGRLGVEAVNLSRNARLRSLFATLCFTGMVDLVHGLLLKGKSFDRKWKQSESCPQTTKEQPLAMPVVSGVARWFFIGLGDDPGLLTQRRV